MKALKQNTVIANTLMPHRKSSTSDGGEQIFQKPQEATKSMTFSDRITAIKQCIPEMIKCLEYMQNANSESLVEIQPVYSSAGRFLIWLIQYSHFHPLLEIYPNGFILISELPSPSSSYEKSISTPPRNAPYNLKVDQEAVAAHVHWCRQLAYEHVNQLHQVVRCGFLSNPMLELLQLQGFEHSDTVLEGQFDFTSPVQSTHGSGDALSTFGARPHEYAILEHRLLPIPVEVVRYLLSYLTASTTLAEKHKIHCSPVSGRFPIVFTVNDETNGCLSNTAVRNPPPKSFFFVYFGIDTKPSCLDRAFYNTHTSDRFNAPFLPPTGRANPSISTEIALKENNRGEGFLNIISLKVPMIKISFSVLEELTISDFVALCTQNTIAKHFEESATTEQSAAPCSHPLPLIATSRYDALWKSPMKSTIGTDSFILKNQSTNSSCRVMAGPLLSLLTSWEIAAPHRDKIGFSLPSPNPSKCDAVVVLRAGSSGGPFIHSFYHQLKLLTKLHRLHKHMQDTLEIEEHPNFTAAFNAPLHSDDSSSGTIESCHMKRLGTAGVQQVVHAFINEENRLYLEGLQHHPTLLVTNSHSHLSHLPAVTTDAVQTNYAETFAEMESLFTSFPARADRDFVDRLWLFLQRMYSLNEVLEALQLILEAMQPKESLVSRATVSPSLSCNDLQPLLPVMRQDNPTEIAKLVKVAIRMWQLHRYGGVGAAEELSSNLQIWNAERNKYKEHHYLPNLIVNMGTHSLCRDAVNLIYHTDPSTSSTDLEWYTNDELPSDALLHRLERLQKVCEIALLAKRAALPNDCLRKTIRCALSYYKANDERSCPLFAVPLTRLNTSHLLAVWTQHRVPSYFTLKTLNTQIKLRLASFGQERLLDLDFDQHFDALKLVGESRNADKHSNRSTVWVDCYEKLGSLPLCLWPSSMDRVATKSRNSSHHSPYKDNPKRWMHLPAASDEDPPFQKLFVYNITVLTKHNVAGGNLFLGHE